MLLGVEGIGMIRECNRDKGIGLAKCACFKQEFVGIVFLIARSSRF
jgi:hypothetical protein